MADRYRVTREETSRPDFTGDMSSQLYVDSTGLADDMELAWLAETVNGQHAPRLEFNMRNRGYRPVTTDELKGMRPFDLPGRKTEDNLIRNGGLILMKRLKAHGDAEREAQRERAVENVESAQRIQRTDGRNFKEAEGNTVKVSNRLSE